MLYNTVIMYNHNVPTYMRHEGETVGVLPTKQRGASSRSRVLGEETKRNKEQHTTRLEGRMNKHPLIEDMRPSSISGTS